MDFNDKEIIQERREQQEARFKDIYAGEVRAGTESLYFHPVNLCNNKFSIMLPESFVDLPLAMAKLKYPMEKRPPIIKTNDDTTVNIAFSYYEHQDFSEKQVEKATTGLKAGIGRMQPGLSFFDAKFDVTNQGIKFGYIDFLSKSLDGELYQLFAFVPIHNKFLQIVFNCPYKRMRAWTPIIVQVLKSVEEIEPDILSNQEAQ